MNQFLSVDGLTLGYGNTTVCRDISFGVNEGEVVTLIGANGAGKTTTMLAVAGLLPARSGSVHFMDHDITGMTPHRRTALGISLVPEGRHIFGRMTVLENLSLGGYIHRRKSAQIRGDLDGVLDRFPRLRERASQRAGTLSGGEQQMLAVGRALMGRPRLLCLDEPSLGLAPIVVREIFDIIREISREGTTVLFVEQNASQALATARRGYVLQTGSVVAEGSADELGQDSRVRDAYLGQSGD